MLGATTALTTACGDNHVPPPADAGGVERRTLEILPPPGEQVGLAFGETADLGVRYTDDQGVPIAAAPVTFALVSDGPGEAPAGSSLSASEALTDTAGVARVTLAAGADRTRFRVQVDAAQATSLLFYVTVANEGFAALEATPRHVGDRPASDFAVVELRLYNYAAGAPPTPCATLDPAAPPPSPFPPRTFAAFDQIAHYYSLAADESYAVLAWGRNAAGETLAAGCVDLYPAQVRPSTTLRFDVDVADFGVALASGYAIYSTFDLAALADLLFAPGPPGWGLAPCTLGPAQLVLDCALDALDGSDAENDDCVVESPGAVADEIAAARGALDMGGCRGPDGPMMLPSADAAVMTALTALGPTAPAAAWTLQATSLSELADGLTLRSALTIGGSAATHALLTATLDVSGATLDVDLPSSARPIVTVAGIPVTFGGQDLTLGEHGYTLRLGAALADAFTALVLVPAGSGATPWDLGTALTDAASSGPMGLTGCAAISDAACGAAGRPSDCLLAACLASRPALDAALAAPFTRLDTMTIDFRLAGVVAAQDGDGDRVAETLAGGIWSAQLVVDGADLPAIGSFSGAALP